MSPDSLLTQRHHGVDPQDDQMNNPIAPVACVPPRLRRTACWICASSARQPGRSDPPIEQRCARRPAARPGPRASERGTRKCPVGRNLTGAQVSLRPEVFPVAQVLPVWHEAHDGRPVRIRLEGYPEPFAERVALGETTVHERPLGGALETRGLLVRPVHILLPRKDEAARASSETWRIIEFAPRFLTGSPGVGAGLPSRGGPR